MRCLASHRSEVLEFGMGGSFTGSMTEADQMLRAAVEEVAGSRAEAVLTREATGGGSGTLSLWGSSPGNLSPGTRAARR